MKGFIKTSILWGGLLALLFLFPSCGTSIQDAQEFIGNKPPAVTLFNAVLPEGISSSSIVGGMAVDVTVEASDPEGLPLDYAFSSESGSFANKTLTGDGCTVQFITSAGIAGGQDVIISLSVTDEKQSRVTTSLNIGTGKQGPALTVDQSPLQAVKSVIGRDGSTSFTFSSDSNGYYQVQSLDNVTDSRYAVVDDNIALYRYTTSGDALNPNIVTINIAGALALDPGGKTVRLSADDGVKNVWLLFWDGLDQFDKHRIEVASDGTPPEILSITPSSGSTGVPVDTSVTITFSDNLSGIDQSSLTGALQVTSLSSTMGTGTTPLSSFTGDTAVYTVSGLEYGAGYSLEVQNVRDVAGNSISLSSYDFTAIQSSNANLKTLFLSDGFFDMDPLFQPSVTSYFCPVPYDLKGGGGGFLTITPDAAESHASVSVAGNPVASGSSIDMTVGVGQNTIDVIVTAQDGTTKTYSLDVYRAVPVLDILPSSANPGDKGVEWVIADRFSVNDNTLPGDPVDDTITDNITGLEWIAYLGASPIADGWVNSLNNTPTGWRLPNIRELHSLFHHGFSNGAAWLYGIGFGCGSCTTTIPNGFPYWTSTGVSRADKMSGVEYYVHAYGISSYISSIRLSVFGGTPSLTNSYALYVRDYASGPGSCVPQTGQTTSLYTGDDGELQKGIPWPATRFRINDDVPGERTIKDFLTGLTWVSTATNIGPYVLTDAISKIGSMNMASYGGRSDWRLPNVNELETLLNYDSSTTPKVYLAVQGFLQAEDPLINTYWTSTPRASDPTNASYAIDFATPAIGSNMNSTEYYIWAVRGPDY